MFRTAFFSLYKMVENENVLNSCNNLKISTWAIIQNPEMLETVSDNLKTKKMCKNAVKKVLSVTMHAPDQH